MNQQLTFVGPWRVQLDGEERELEFGSDGTVDLNALFGVKVPVMGKAVLRNRFTVPAAGSVTLGMGADWFFECRVNGQMVYSTMETGNGDYPIAVRNHIGEIDVPSGESTIEITAFAGAQSFVVAFGEVPPLRAELALGPWLQHIAPGAVTVSFTTVDAVPAGIDWRCADGGASEWTRSWHVIGGQICKEAKIHHVRLTGLRKNAVYEYRVVLLLPYRAMTPRVGETVYTFRAATDDPVDFSFFATADTQYPPARREEYLARYWELPALRDADFFAHLGDIYSTYLNWEDAQFGLFTPYLEATSHARPIVSVRGNHEYYGAQTNRWFDYWGMENGESYGLFRYGAVCFVVLDCGDDAPPSPHPSLRVLNDPEPFWQKQSAWLAAAVESPAFQTAQFRVVLAHGLVIGDWKEYMPGKLRQMIDPLFGGRNPRYLLHLWLGGHVHYALRSLPGRNRVKALAAWTKALKAPHPAVGENYRFTTVATAGPLAENPPEMQLSGLHVEVTDGRLRVASVDADGRCFDRIAIAPDGTVTEEFTSAYFQEFDLG